MAKYKELFVPADIAKALAEKGFNWTCKAEWVVYRNGKASLATCGSNLQHDFCTNVDLRHYNDDEQTFYAAPTIQMVVQWLYEEHELFLTVTPDINDHLCFYAEVYRKDIGPEGVGSTWEEVAVQDLNDPLFEPCKQFWDDPKEASLYLIRLCLKHLV